MGLDRNSVDGRDIAPKSVDTESLNDVDSPANASELESLFANQSAGQTIALRPNTTYELSGGLPDIAVTDFTFVGPRSAVLTYPSGGSIAESFVTVGVSGNADRYTIRGFSIDATNQADPATFGIENDPDGCGVIVDGNTVSTRDGVVEDLHISHVSNEAIGFLAVDEARVNDNIIVDFGFRGIHPHAGHPITTVNNIIRDSTGSNVETAIRHSRIIKGNVIENVDGRGIYGSDDESVISGNTLRDVTVAAIQCWSKNHDLISNNSIFSCQTGVRAAQDRATITNNKIIDTGTRAIIVENGATDVVIKLNHIQNASQDNGGTYNGIKLDNVSNVEIRENTIKNPGSTEYGFAIKGFNGISNCIIVDNHLEPGAGDALATLGDTTLVRRNTGFNNQTTVSASAPSLGWDTPLVFLDGSSNSVDAVLPDPAAFPDEELILKSEDSTNTTKYSQNGTEAIDGSAERTLSATDDAHTIRSDGTNWHIVSAVDASAV